MNAQAGAQAGATSGTASTVTLHQLIDLAHRHKRLELAAATARLAGESRPAAAPASPGVATVGNSPWHSDPVDGSPRLWSLQSLGGRWRAEVLHDGAIHTVQSPPAGSASRLGPWRILGLDAEGLLLEQAASVGRRARQLVIPPPRRGTAAAGFRFLELAPPFPDGGPAVLAAEPTRPGRPEDEAVRRAAALPVAAAGATSDASAP